MTAQDVKRKVMEEKLTLIGYPGLSNIYHTLKGLHDRGITGDFVETGVWKGGACMYARAVMNELQMDGKVYACDSFKGVPEPDLENFPLDEGDYHYEDKELAVSLDEVKSYFEDSDLMEGVVFVEGWFKDTMPKLKDEIKTIGILRLDGDMYESTMEVLDNLYDKVSIAGFVIVDDYGLDRCRWAIDDFVKKRNIFTDLKHVEHTQIVMWQKIHL